MLKKLTRWYFLIPKSNQTILNSNFKEKKSPKSKTKFLGVIIDNRLAKLRNWQHHINYMPCKVVKGIGIIMKVRNVLDDASLRSLYFAFIYPYMMYCNHIWGNVCSIYLNKLVVLQKKVIRIIDGVKSRTPTANLFDNLNIMKVIDLNAFLIAQVMHKVHTADIINAFQCMFIANRYIHSHETRQSDHLNIPLNNQNVGKTSIRYRNNVLKSVITLSCSQITFKQQLKTQISAGNIKDQLH